MRYCSTLGTIEYKSIVYKIKNNTDTDSESRRVLPGYEELGSVTIRLQYQVRVQVQSLRSLSGTTASTTSTSTTRRSKTKTSKSDENQDLEYPVRRNSFLPTRRNQHRMVRIVVCNMHVFPGTSH